MYYYWKIDDSIRIKEKFFLSFTFFIDVYWIQGSDPPLSTWKNSILFQCLSVSTMDTSRNRTWLRRMASLLWLVFLFVGVSAGTLEKLHEGKSFPIFIQIPLLVYFVRVQLKYIHFVINLKKIWCNPNTRTISIYVIFIAQSGKRHYPCLKSIERKVIIIPVSDAYLWAASLTVFQWRW